MLPTWPTAASPLGAHPGSAMAPYTGQPAHTHPSPYVELAAGWPHSYDAGPPVLSWWEDRMFTPPRQLRYAMDRSWSHTGWPLIGNDLWRIIHNLNPGACTVDSRIARLGLGAALLAELAVAGQIAVSGGYLRLADRLARFLEQRRELPAVGGADRSGLAEVLPDKIAGEFVGVFLREPQPLPVDAWVKFLAQESYEKVARRMVSAGYVGEQRRFGRRRASYYPPHDQNVAGWPATRLGLPLKGPSDPAELDVVLLGLCRAMQVTESLFSDQPADRVAALCRLADDLPHPLPPVISALDAATRTVAGRLR